MDRLLLRSLSTTPPGGQMVSSLGPPSPITLARKYDSVPGMYAHRPATPTLTYPQFLEAIRLIAEDIVGHPQVGGLLGWSVCVGQSPRY